MGATLANGLGTGEACSGLSAFGHPSSAPGFLLIIISYTLVALLNRPEPLGKDAS